MISPCFFSLSCPQWSERAEKDGERHHYEVVCLHLIKCSKLTSKKLPIESWWIFTIPLLWPYFLFANGKYSASRCRVWHFETVFVATLGPACLPQTFHCSNSETIYIFPSIQHYVNFQGWNLLFFFSFVDWVSNWMSGFGFPSSLNSNGYSSLSC